MRPPIDPVAPRAARAARARRASGVAQAARAAALVAVMAGAVAGGCGRGATGPTARAGSSADPGGTPVATTATTAIPARRVEPTGPVAFTTTTLTFTDTTRGTVARPPVPASPSRVLRTTVRVPDGPGPWPLVVFGHGFAVSPATYTTLLDGLAAAGFAVAAPDFPGSSSGLAGHPDEHDLQDEPCDLLLVAQQIQAAAAADGSGPLAGRVQAGPVGLGGQSDGATAAAFAALTSTCAGPPVGAVVAFSAKPAPPRAGLDPSGYPALVAITGTADEVNPASETRALFDEFPTRAWLVSTIGEGHLEPSTTSPHLADIVAVIVDVLRAALYDDPTATNRIATDASGRGLTIETHP